MPTHRAFIATYIMASQRNGTVYVGMTSNLTARVWKHKTDAFDGFTEANACKLLVRFEQHQWVVEAIRREKRLKKWLRDWEAGPDRDRQSRMAGPRGGLVSRQRSGLDPAAGRGLTMRAIRRQPDDLARTTA